MYFAYDVLKTIKEIEKRLPGCKLLFFFIINIYVWLSNMNLLLLQKVWLPNITVHSYYKQSGFQTSVCSFQSGSQTSLFTPTSLVPKHQFAPSSLVPKHHCLLLLVWFPNITVYSYQSGSQTSLFASPCLVPKHHCLPLLVWFPNISLLLLVWFPNITVYPIQSGSQTSLFAPSSLVPKHHCLPLLQSDGQTPKLQMAHLNWTPDLPSNRRFPISCMPMQ